MKINLPCFWFIKVDYVGAHKFVQLFYSKTIIVYCAFPVLPVEKKSFFIDQATLVLTNNFLKLNSFSRTIHILISAANLANLLDLPENLATDFFKKKSIAFFDFCRYPGRTKQHFCFCLVLGFSWDSERKINLHCKKYFLAMCIAIFLM